MDFDNFFRIIHTGVDSYNLYELIVEFFSVANDSLLITEEMAGNWIKGNNRSYKKQLKEGRKFRSFDDKNFISFLKSHTNMSWVNIQNEFKNEYDNNQVINCSTTEHDVFLQSIMFQFKEIIRYPYTKPTIPTEHGGNTTIETEKAPPNEAPSRQMTKEFERLISKYKIAYFICGELSYSQRVDEFVEATKIGLLAKFINEQEDDMYKKISEFNETLYGFNITLDELNPSNVRAFHLNISFLRTSELTLLEILEHIAEDKNRLIARRDNPTEKEVLSEQVLSEEIRQLIIIEDLLGMYSKTNSLYGLICTGKTLLVF